jgi:hypothetical protein
LPPTVIVAAPADVDAKAAPIQKPSAQVNAEIEAREKNRESRVCMEGPKCG